MNVFIATDGSENAEKAFNWYFANMHKEANLVIIYSHADKPNIPTTAFGGEELGVAVLMAEEVQRMIVEHNQKCQKLEEKLEEKCREKATHWKVIVHTSDESAGHSIVERAENEQADVIITGCRGLGAFRRTILGSVSDYVLHHAKVPVLVCHF